MKIAPLVLTVSLLGNAALVGVLTLRKSPPPAATPAAAPVATASTASAGHGSVAALRAALASGDIAALQSAGVPADVARNIILGRAMSRFGERMRALQPSDGKWWHNRSLANTNREELAVIRRELGSVIVDMFGDDLPGLFSNATQLSFLPQPKRDALRRVTQDYDEMFAKFGAGGIQLASDRERLKLLREERDRDIAALLTPDERTEYELRTSQSAASLRARYGDAIESEEDFRKLFALQKAFDEKFSREAMTASGGRVSPEVLQQRAAAERQMQEDMRAALGDEKYAALRRASDSDLRNVESLASRLNLPANTTDRVAAARDNFALQSQQINANTALTPPQRRDQIQALAARAKDDLARTLGTEAGEAYAQRSPWVSMLQGGMAFSTNPKDAPGGVALGAQSVFPVMPAGATGGTATRQIVNIVGDRAVGGAVTDGGTMFFTPAAPVRVDSQVISIGTSGPADGATTERRVIVAPPAQGGTTTPPRP